MRHLILALGLLLPFLSLAQEEIQYKEYSYSEFFQMIEDEEDSVFTLRDAIIKADPRQDTLHYAEFEQFRVGFGSISQVFDNWLERDAVEVNKPIKLNNVQFIAYGLGNESEDGEPIFIQAGLNKIKFLEPVELTNSLSAIFRECSFEKGLVTMTNNTTQVLNAFRSYEKITLGGLPYTNTDLIIISSTIQESFEAVQRFETPNNYNFILRNSVLPKFNSTIGISLKNHNFEIVENEFENLMMSFNGASGIMRGSHFRDVIWILVRSESDIAVLENTFESFVLFEKDASTQIDADWEQWFGKYTPSNHFSFNYSDIDAKNVEESVRDHMFGRESIQIYQDSIRSSNKVAYRMLTKELADFYNEYKKNHDTENANLVYRDIKDLETQRLAFLYNQNPNFKTFFKWRINQFLKVFSAYGTEPERAIIFSVYVILAFALVYLFFPNYWDSHGKNRIMDRYRFFLKYVNKDSGIHEVYLDEKKPELLASEDFKVYLQEQGKTAPKFFMATALPLYRWSVAGTKSFSWLLSKVDVLKGKWSDTEDSKRGGKSFLLITAFLIALLYDVFIKMLNALMLSINTFTTLGFGEIPIKGLPRYLAIIQGFIGWFMLTIFSVSLISQLLN